MTADDNSDDGVVTLAQQIFGRASAIPNEVPPVSKATDGQEDEVEVAAGRETPPATEISPPTAASLVTTGDVAQPKRFKTAAELAEIIELDLARHPDCPKAGFRVTVYGGSHWRAMLTITPAAGGVRNPQEWRELTNDLAERLRKRYDLAWE